MQQPLEQRLAERQHHVNVQQALAVILERTEELGEDHHADEQDSRQMEAAQARCRVQLIVEQHSINDEPHEERLEHFKSRSQQRQDKECHDRVTMWPKPAAVLAQILAPLAMTLAFGLRQLAFVSFYRAVGLLLAFAFLRIVETVPFVIFDETEVTPARRTAMTLRVSIPLAHNFAARRRRISSTRTFISG